ncbi:hypothetical protein FOMPIDRAFT_93925 [Fomitopsis schrenkii]|uniref:Uncharacterized protein n=1 Tax=Fomitopsis schrenkii TaxID=2126942 RepID=S8DPB7_FOMSC|nr:hypothetical protein FOMPIDRAFT_93925 [Fomitopsis schrenkii]
MPAAWLNPKWGVFVSGGSTATGAFAIQLAKWAVGCRFAASTSVKNEVYVHGLGQMGWVFVTQWRHPSFLRAVGLIDPGLSKSTLSEEDLTPGGTFMSVGPQPHGFDVAAMVWLTVHDCFLLRQPHYSCVEMREFLVLYLLTLPFQLVTTGLFLEQWKLQACLGHSVVRD